MRKKQNRQQTLFLQLYEPVHDRFERFCRARVYGKMEYTDLMNDTLLIAYPKFSTLKSEEAFLSFLIGISVRVLSNHHKKKKEESFSEKDLDVLDQNAATDSEAEVYLLHQALAKLPDMYSECLILFEITGFSIKEISALQNVSEAAVKQRLKRGREKLAMVLATKKELEVEDGRK